MLAKQADCIEATPFPAICTTQLSTHSVLVALTVGPMQ